MLTKVTALWLAPPCQGGRRALADALAQNPDRGLASGGQGLG